MFLDPITQKFTDVHPTAQSQGCRELPLNMSLTLFKSTEIKISGGKKTQQRKQIRRSWWIAFRVELFSLRAPTASLCSVSVDIYPVAFTVLSALGRFSRRLSRGLHNLFFFSFSFWNGDERGSTGQSILSTTPPPPTKKKTPRYLSTRCNLHDDAAISPLERRPQLH